MANSSPAATPTQSLKQITFAFPFRKKGQGNGGAAADFTDEHEMYQLLKQESSGSFPVSSGGMWHGGIHVTEAGAGQSMDFKAGVRCIADGEVVAWRLNRAYLVNQIPATDGQPAINASYSTGFALVKHTMEFPRGTTLTFFSLYMHLQDYAGYESDSTLPWPAYWAAKVEVTQEASDKPKSGANGQPAPDGQTGLNVRASKPHGAVLGILPRGTQVSLSKREGSWGQIADAPGALYAPKVGEYVDPAVAIGKWIFLGKEHGHDGPVVKNVVPDSFFDSVNVVLEGRRVKVKAGDVLGYLGRFDSLRNSTSIRMVHIEVFCDDTIKQFIEDGRNWVDAHIEDTTGNRNQWNQLGVSPDPTILRVNSGVHLYQAPPPAQPGEEPNPTDVIQVCGFATLPHDASHMVTETQPGNDGHKRTWWKIDSEDVQRHPVSGWVREQSFAGGMVTREHAQSWVDFECHDEDHDPAHTIFANTQDYVAYQAGQQQTPDRGSKAKLSPLMAAIYGVLFPTGDGVHAVDELSSIGQGAQGSGFPWVAFRASRLIPKHESEWANPAKWQDLIAAIEQHTGPRPEHEEEKKRIANLVWWDEVKAGVPGFPGSDVFHIHPIGLVGNFFNPNPDVCACGCCMTVTGTRFKAGANTFWYGPQHSGSISLGNCAALATMRTNGTLSETEEKILRAMSQNEGKVDTVQAIDKAIISAGAMQKTIRGAESRGELATQIAAFRDAHPAEYQQYFSNCGWTVTGSGDEAALGYAHATFTNGVRMIGDELYTALRRDCSVHTFGKPVECPPVASMAHAVSSPLYQVLQVKDFVDRLNHAIGKTPGGYPYPIKDYLQSPLGRATVLDQDVNAPGATANSMKASLDRFFQHNPRVSRNPAEWGANGTAYETSILQDYGPSRYMAHVNGVSVAPQRYEHLLQALGTPS
ncbi:hypothetical protein [Paraburkholderia sp. CNPSo 3281]|uniref:hypothetical protein n=1 Tax=Paraburkholderia sp. CNPSo 3281 TaxID=2940933 RepID=UPI0020B65767|nr:hypothetical protein [Paraburkholderia sp. CNPSo 3281]MCP3715989.1 hypothetical protein [Paraburkholderia sp. CNPSo 3281]